uniref:Uncharacterized protein n=1 Tax=Leersia perrieri TaxID=77586 RepID=A0A0D9WWL3_9ORYZ
MAKYPSPNQAMAAIIDVATSAAASSPPQLHIVVFPWLAFGHMIPFLELSKRLARRGHAVTFISTPRNAARLGAIPPELLARLRIVSLDLPAVDGLPNGAESTADVPQEKIGLLKKAFDGLAVPFAGLIADICTNAGDGDAAINATGFSRKPDWIILDFAQYWIWPIADEHEIPCAMFSIVPATMVAFIGPKSQNSAHPRSKTEDYMVQPPWIPFPANIAYRRHEAEWIATTFKPNASGVADMNRFWEVERPQCRLIIYRSCPEVEPQLFPILTDLFAKPAVPAGLLVFPEIPRDAAAACDKSDETFTPAMEWLDKQPDKSVIYVALGSEAPLTSDHVRELALGLELADVKFIWAFRAPSHDGVRMIDLPDGFESRIAARGLVCTKWVPQLRVLAHRAVGGFLTHCGWGSTVESFRFGHPLVMLPFITDQGLIAQAMAARGIGVEVARNYDDGSFHRGDVAAAVRRVMVETDGKTFARNAKELHDVLRDKERQEMYLSELKPAMAATREVATTASSPRPLHIVVFPWLAFGHMIPFLELSKRLARRGHAVTFVSTPRNVVRLGAIPPELSVRLRVVSLNLPAVDGLPEGAESTTDVPPDKIELFKIAFDGLAAQFASLIGGNGEDDGSTGFSRKPDWIIQDVVQNWTGSIAEEHKIPCASFNIFPAAMVAFLGPKKENLAHPRTKTEDYMVKPPWITFPANLAFRRHEAEWIATMFKPNASGVADIDRFWSIEHPCCRLIIYRSCLEAEPPMSPILTDLFAKPALPAGLLIFPEIVDDDAVIVSDQSFLPAIEWLDEKPDKSVIYVALGSEAPVTADHVRELAFGLELADVNFIWAIRPPSHGAFLPNGFESCVAHAGWCARSGYRSCACLRIVRSGVS